MPAAWILYCVLSASAIQGIEYLNRTSATSTGFFSQLIVTGPLILLAQWALFETWRGAPHALGAWLAFTLLNTVLRLTVVRFALGEPFQWWGLLGVAGMMASAWVVKESLR